MKNDYTKTVHACFMSYIVQAIINNFVPLLFLTFQAEYGISLSRITMLVTVNFGVQLLVDFLSAGFIDRIGYRASILTAHVLCALGLISLTVLPGVMPHGSQRAFVHRFLFSDFPVPLSGIGTCRLRPMRVFRGDHVAGNLQPGFRIHPGRRFSFRSFWS